ncbi:ABC transporter permease [Sediminispirochaeta smaragdinae]|jgi:ribose transport system permease protein|uniref:Inner-membrane translocator n=1 Tax=Sediminispirochaeta smaragdinae (strain DSM 11293 / JCM 15392 / SEBR 4228) TaxID=573413 RepID=E1R2W6_SEDSS|nr:ABC transporter permease [Sediminispirochaeta smaragdinae]ADK80398.1 inner-membrane translocator [Sediminispirochaeta smaragdinae DSM 11293]
MNKFVAFFKSKFRSIAGEIDNVSGLLLALCALILFFSLRSDHFLSEKTLATIANQIPVQMVLAVGMTYVLIIAGIDLSIGSVLALCSTVLSLLLIRFHMPLPVALLLTTLTGICAGFINGLLSAWLSIPSFIVTLGMMEIARGLAYILSDSRTIYIGTGIACFAASLWGGISVAFLIAIAISVVGQLLLKYTVLGTYLSGIGTKASDMPLSDALIRKIKIFVFSIMGMLVAIASMFHTAKLEAADPNAGSGLELQVIASVVIGGTSLLGGKGSVVNSMFGVLIMAVLQTGLAQLGVDDPLKQLITGLLIIIALLLDRYREQP